MRKTSASSNCDLTKYSLEDKTDVTERDYKGRRLPHWGWEEKADRDSTLRITGFASPYRPRFTSHKNTLKHKLSWWNTCFSLEEVLSQANANTHGIMLSKSTRHSYLWQNPYGANILLCWVLIRLSRKVCECFFFISKVKCLYLKHLWRCLTDKLYMGSYVWVKTAVWLLKLLSDLQSETFSQGLNVKTQMSAVRCSRGFSTLCCCCERVWPRRSPAAFFTCERQTLTNVRTPFSRVHVWKQLWSSRLKSVQTSRCRFQGPQ